jgi:hypothetical protein
MADIPGDRLPFRGSIQEHAKLLTECGKIMRLLINTKAVQAAAAPTLVHSDFSKRNIYVSSSDPAVVTGVIDWQLTCVEPAFIYAHQNPDFAALPDENPADNDEEPRSREEEKLLKDLSICHQTYNVMMKGMVPKLRPSRLLDPTLSRLFHYCFTTWRDGVLAIRQELLDLKTHWTDLGLPGSCPYSPSDDELRVHAQQFEDFETMHKLKQWLKVSMDTTSDGWVPNELWDAAKEANRAAYDQWMQTAREAEARGENMTVEKADALWPFDAR